MSIHKDWAKPLSELYQPLDAGTKKWVRERLVEITRCSLGWFSVVIISILTAYLITIWNPLDKPLETWFQRAGSLVSLISGLFEGLFVYRLRELIKVSHPYSLCCEFYVERKRKWLLTLASIGTAITFTIGTVIWGYGDIIYQWINNN